MGSCYQARLPASGVLPQSGAIGGTKAPSSRLTRGQQQIRDRQRGRYRKQRRDRQQIRYKQRGGAPQGGRLR